MRTFRSLVITFALIAGAPTSLLADAIARISVSAAGVTGDGTSDAVAMSADGSVVAFRSDASNLGPTDTNGLSDVYVKSLKSGAVEIASMSTAGVQGDGFSGGSQSDERPIRISSDGRFVAFQSTATTLNGNDLDTNVVPDIFVRDRSAQTTTLVSLDSAGGQGDASADSPGISDDGQVVVFESSSGLFQPIDTSGLQDIFRKDLGTGTTTRASSNRFSNVSDGGARLPSISGDGTLVVYQSAGTDHVPQDSNGSIDIFLYNSGTLAISRLSTSAQGSEGFGSSRNAEISNDGAYVVFESDADGLVPEDTNGRTDIFRKEIASGAIELVSKSSAGVPGNGSSYSPAVSADGQFVVFKSDADNLVDSDTNGSGDVFVRDMSLGTIKRVSFRSDGSESNGTIGYLTISGNGQYVAFSSSDDQLVPGDSNGVPDIYRVQISDTLTNDTTIASPPLVTVRRKAVTLTLQLFDSVEAPQIAAPRRRTFVEYTVNVRQTGRGGERSKIISRRNQITLRNLPPGNYVASYRAAARQRITTKRDGEKTVREVTLFRTNISPRAQFTVP